MEVRAVGRRDFLRLDVADVLEGSAVDVGSGVSSFLRRWSVAVRREEMRFSSRGGMVMSCRLNNTLEMEFVG